jgi:hypothetical protein
LLTSFSQRLANALAHKLALLLSAGSPVLRRMTDVLYRSVADATPWWHPTSRSRTPSKAAAAGSQGFTPCFRLSEWRHVVDAWQINDVDAYAWVPRLGRKNRMSTGQRERLWPVLAALRASPSKRGLTTWPEVYERTAAHCAARDVKPFTHVVVGEAQDLGVAELRFLSAIMSREPTRCSSPAIWRSGSSSSPFLEEAGRRCAQPASEYHPGPSI